jgi:hypothetical protein
VKLGEVLKDRAAMKALLDPSDPRYVVGTEADRAKARDEWHAHRILAQLMRSDLEEVRRADLRPFRFGLLEHERTGRFYQRHRGALVELHYVPNAVAWFVAADGSPVVLEKPSGPQTRAELEQQQAERAQRRNAPRPTPAWKR